MSLCDNKHSSLLLILIIFGGYGNCDDDFKDIKELSGPTTTTTTPFIQSELIGGDDFINRRQQHQLWQTVGSSLSVQADIRRSDDHFSSDNDEPAVTHQVIRRRPGGDGNRKRKRRPQTYSTERVETVSNEQQWRGQVHDETAAVVNTNTNTNTNDDEKFIQTGNSIKTRSKFYSTQSTPKPSNPRIREPLAALEKEQKLYELRDKQRNDFVINEPVINRDKSYRKPYSQAKKDDVIVTDRGVPLKVASTGTGTGSGTASGSGPIDLKNILKNSGGLSLSEILQQKNLSLDDLLKGKHSALQAIRMSPTTTTITTLDDGYSTSGTLTDSSTTKYNKPLRRLPSTSFLAPTLSINKFLPPVEPKSTPPPPNHRQKIKKKPSSNSLRYQIRNDPSASSTLKSIEVVGTPYESSTDKSPNIFEMATIVTLRDNPVVRKNIIYPSRPRIKNIGSLVSGDTAVIAKSTTIEKVHTTIQEDATTTAIPAYRKRTSFRPKIKLPSLQKTFQTDLPSSSSSPSPPPSLSPLSFVSSSESDSHEIENTEKHTDDKPSNDNIDQFPLYDSVEEITETTKKQAQFSTTPVTITVSPHIEQSSKATTTIKTVSQEVVEEKLKLSNPEENFVDNFEELESQEVVTLEELFNDSSFKPEAVSFEEQQSYQVITPRIDEYPNKPRRPHVTETNPSLFMDLSSDQSIDDRTELLELMEDRRSGNRLFKVLAQRNMTIEELIEHRRRGSSQLHLSQIINNKSRILPSKLQANLDIVTAFENFPHFNLIDLKSVKPDEIKTDSQGASYFTSIIDIEPTDEVYKEGRSLGKPTMQAQHQRQQQQPLQLAATSSHNPEKPSKKSLHFFPSWKTLSLASYAASNDNTFLENQHNSGHHHQHHHIVPPNDVDIIEPIFKIEDDINTGARTHDILDLELSGHAFKRNPSNNIDGFHIPAGVQSAIIASAAIVGISLVIFLIVFVACRWREKRRKKLNYIEQYNAMKTKLPAIISQNTILKNDSDLMNSNKANSLENHNCGHMSNILYHGGNQIDNMDPNSPTLHEYLFESMRKPF